MPKEEHQPVNRIDAIAMQHDIEYISKDLQDRHVADVKMIHRMDNIPNPTFREKLERFLIKSIMKGKIMIGQGLPEGVVKPVLRLAKDLAIKKIFENPDYVEEVKDTKLLDEDPLAKELHHENKRVKKFLKVKIFAKDNTHSADLAIMLEKSTDECNLILVVIDLYTRYVWCVPSSDNK